MNKFKILVVVLIAAFVGLFIYLEVPVENNREAGPGTTIEYYQSYVDVNGNPITDYYGTVSTDPVLGEQDFESFDEDTQAELEGKVIGDSVTYEQDLSQYATESIDETTMPYTYTITINKVKVNHEADEEEASEETDADSTDDSDTTDENNSENEE